jgi:spore germination protein KA
MKEIANPKIIKEVKRRIQNLDIDFAIGDGVLDQLIEDHPFSLFPQIISTERPDRTASFLMDGKVALICDGTPFASIVPVTFFHMFHTSEDSTIRWQYATFLRYIRVIASFFAALLPGLYVALTLYHKEMIPTELLSSLHKARENVPFPTLIEVLLLEVSFEIIREAGVRVPGVIGQTLGIIGAIVLGQAAVAAGLVSPVLIIIVAITGLGSFSIPNFNLAFSIRIVRFIFIFLGALFGFYGIAAGLYVFGSIAASMKSFGVPYFSPVAPKTKSSPDVVNKAPAWAQTQRPDFLNTKDRRRGGEPVRKWTDGKDGEKQQ